jgi:hypothetical protein
MGAEDRSSFSELLEFKLIILQIDSECWAST